MKNHLKKIIIFATPVMMICGLLGATAPSARAEDEERACTNRSLRGDYGFTVEGLVLPGPGIALPIRGVALTHFNGRGGATQVDHVVFNGLPPAEDWTPAEGTYHVNADCTGTVHLDIPSTHDFLNLRIVVVREGREIHTVVTAPFNGPARTVTSIGIKVE